MRKGTKRDTWWIGERWERRGHATPQIDSGMVLQRVALFWAEISNKFAAKKWKKWPWCNRWSSGQWLIITEHIKKKKQAAAAWRSASLWSHLFKVRDQIIICGPRKEVKKDIISVPLSNYRRCPWARHCSGPQSRGTALIVGKISVWFCVIRPV